MTEPLVSIVILSFNGIEYLRDCLSSVLAQTYPNMEVVVLDNASGDGSADLVEREFPSVRLIRSDSNLGYAAGNNVAISLTHGEYVVLLNQDTKSDPRWIEELVRVAEQDKGLGACAPKLLYMDEPARLNGAGQLLTRDLITLHRGIGELDQGQYDRCEEVFGASAAAALYRRVMLDEIGLFDEDYFIFREDDELNFRARLAGWRCCYVPTAVVYHARSASTGLYSPLKLYYGERNRIWNVVKLLPLPLILSSLPYTVRRHVAMAVFATRSKERKAQVARQHSLTRLTFTLLRAWLDAVRGLPKMVRKRREIQRTKKVSNREIKGWLRRYEAALSNVVEK